MLLLFALILASCQQPSEFELTNQFDPESPNFRLQPPIGFTASVSTANVFTLSWFPGKFDRAHSQLRYIRGVDTTMILDEVISATSVSYDDVAINATPFHFELRTLVGDTATAWLKTPVFRYELAPITNVFVAGRDDGIDVSWTQAQVGVLTVYNSGSERRIRVPVVHSEVYRSADNGQFELIDTILTQSYKHVFEPEPGVRYRYKVTASAYGMTQESAITIPLRQEYQWESKTLYNTLNYTVPFYVDHSSGELPYFFNGDYSIIIYNLNSGQRTFSKPISEMIDFDHSPYGLFFTFRGQNEFLIGLRNRVYSYNRLTGEKRLVVTLDPTYQIQGLSFDIKTDKLIIETFYPFIENDDMTDKLKAIFVFDMRSNQLHLVLDEIPSYRFRLLETSYPDSKLHARSAFTNDMWIVSLETLAIEYVTVSSNYWMGPIIWSAEHNESAIVQIHADAGFRVERNSEMTPRMLIEYGRIQEVFYDGINQLLYVGFYSGKTVIVDIEDDYRIDKIIDSLPYRSGRFIWNGKLYDPEISNRRMLELQIRTVWLNGN